MGYQGTIAHVGFLNLSAWLDTNQLSHQAIHDVAVILRLICLCIRHKTKVDQFLIGNIVESKEVGTCLLNRIAIRLQRIRVSAWQELSTAMSQAFMQISMQVIAHITIFINKVQRRLINHELLFKTIAMSCLIIGISNVRDGDALRTMLCTNPVSIGQIDTNSCRGIFVATQHSRTNSIGCNAFDMRLAETRIYGRMVFKPLGILTDGLCTLCSLQVLILNDSLPRAFQT